MAFTLEIPPETQTQIERAAAQSQTDVSSFILVAATEKAARITQAQTPQSKRAAALAGLGALSGTGRTVDDFLADKHAEGEAEYDNWAARQKDAG